MCRAGTVQSSLLSLEINMRLIAGERKQLDFDFARGMKDRLWEYGYSPIFSFSREVICNVGAFGNQDGALWWNAVLRWR